MKGAVSKPEIISQTEPDKIPDVIKQDQLVVPEGVEPIKEIEKKKKPSKAAAEVIDQSDRIADALTSDIDDSLKEEIKYICLHDEFIIDGYTLKWNRLSKNLIKKIDEVITFKTLPANITEPDAKQDWMLTNYFKLIYDGFKDDMYFDMSISALKVLEQAPHARIRGLFRRG